MPEIWGVPAQPDMSGLPMADFPAVMPKKLPWRVFSEEFDAEEAEEYQIFLPSGAPQAVWHSWHQPSVLCSARFSRNDTRTGATRFRNPPWEKFSCQAAKPRSTGASSAVECRVAVSHDRRKGYTGTVGSSERAPISLDNTPHVCIFRGHDDCTELNLGGPS
jgi:hypothetical protein